MREARGEFRFCLVNGRLDQGRVLKVVMSHRVQTPPLPDAAWLLPPVGEARLRTAYGPGEKRRAGPGQFCEPMSRLTWSARHGPGLAMRFPLNPELIGGMRVQVGSDVYDGSVQAGIAELKRRFGIVSSNGTRSHSIGA